jgi:uncharacterized protein YkwD
MFHDLANLIRRCFTPAPLIPTPPGPAPLSPAGKAEAVGYFVNAARSARGLPLLARDSLLDAIARDWAAHLAASGVLSHGRYSDRIWSAHPNTAAGEDIAEGQATPEAVVGDWMADPAHRAILMGGYNLIGVGSETGPGGVTFWVADLDQD